MLIDDTRSSWMLGRIASIFLLLAFGASTLRPATAPAQVKMPQGSILTSQAAVLDEATHKAYVVDTERDTVSVVDTADPGHYAIHVGRNPIAVAINAVTHRVYIANHGSGTVSIVDGLSSTLIATVAVDPLPYSIAVDQDTNQVFVSSVYSSALKIINGETNTVSSLKAVSADAMSLDAGAGLLYLLSYESPELTVLDIAGRTLRKLPMGATHLWAVAQNAKTGVLYVTRIGSADVVAYNQKSHASSVVKAGNYPCAIAVNSLTNRIYVVNYADQSLTVIDGATNQVLATVPVGDHPQAVAVNESANEVYVVNVHGNSVTVIDGLKTTVLRRVPVGKNPYGVVVDEQTSVLVTANQGQPSFSRIGFLAPSEKHKADVPR